ncbi:3'-5' exonuclease [Flavobacterium urocaniciphilum]|uniref:Inhibitor of the KinA pathway to sporulation, predicted exonuclease n=1 Tax=Flavobacterium urocaniciphilum TaxID=1299341 RepID=A0A1H9D7C9_9FLAO|nr:3'-5' exonuclease [Flavobacterium urocaniciphilum]SEQ09281.1 Inhibitor of the KinA pathway to sporulation, predicted exonuclease [Flavobacterium urocaniciphilum]
MAKLLDKIIVVDIEATCWEGKLPEGMISDIIEVGVCLLDVETGEISDNRGILIKPERSTISSFCTELTTITPELIEQEGVSFDDALHILKKDYKSQSRAWASFGAYDLRQFQKQCLSLSKTYPFGPSHINVKSLFALKNKLGHELGMDGALKFLNIPLEGTHHRGVDDAKNIAKILREILK